MHNNNIFTAKFKRKNIDNCGTNSVTKDSLNVAHLLKFTTDFLIVKAKSEQSKHT